jgi:hypothetical protein
MVLRLQKIVLAIIIVIGFLWLYKILYIDTALDGKSPLDKSLIKTQTFQINANRDTILIGSNGTLIKLDKNSFSDCRGNQINGLITIKFKEVLSKQDIILSGLNTTSNGDILETGGMLNLQVFQNQNELCIDDSAKIGFIVSAKKYQENMKLYSGILDEKKKTVNWIDPNPLLNESIIIIKQIAEWNQDEISKDEAFEYGILDSANVPLSYNNKFYQDYVNDKFAEYKFQNTLNYIFETSKLGWLNIDRLMEVANTKEVTFVTNVKNSQAFKLINVTLIFKDLNIYISGYPFGNGKYIFGKSRTQKVELPVGERVILLATSYYKRSPYFFYKEINIKEVNNIDIELKESTLEKITQQLKTEI